MFKDISKTDKYYDYILKLANDGILTGYSDGTFRGDNKITRGEFLKLIFSVKGTTLSTDIKNYFLDINDNSWQKKYVNTAVNLGLVNTNNKKFNSNSYISRVEALKMSIILFVGDINNIYSGKYSDVKTEDWFSKYVEYSTEKNLLPTNGNNFTPNNYISRKEVIGVLYNLTR